MSVRYEIDQVEAKITAIVNTPNERIGPRSELHIHCWVCDRRTFGPTEISDAIFASRLRIALKTGAEIYLCEACATVSHLEYLPGLPFRMVNLG